MQRRQQNIYQSARVAAGLTQEQAAETLHIGETTLRGYESGRVTPPDETVVLMAEAYRTPWLRLAHGAARDKLGLLPEDAAPLPMEQSALRMCRQLRELEPHVRRYMEIAEDGAVDKSEEVDLQAVQAAVGRFVATCLAVQCCGTKKDRPDGGTSKRSSSAGEMETHKTCHKDIISKIPQNASKIGAGKAVIL